MRIPVFVSGPTKLNKSQDRSRDRIMRELARLQLEPRALGRSDYPSDFPLREVFVIAKHCSGGIILGAFVSSRLPREFGKEARRNSDDYDAGSLSTSLLHGITWKRGFSSGFNCRS